MNYSTNKVQVSYMMIWEHENSEEVHLKISCDCISTTSQFGYQHFDERPQSNFPDYTNSPTFPWIWAFAPTFHWPTHFQVSRNSRKVATPRPTDRVLVRRQIVVIGEANVPRPLLADSLHTCTWPRHWRASADDSPAKDRSDKAGLPFRRLGRDGRFPSLSMHHSYRRLETRQRSYIGWRRG